VKKTRQQAVVSIRPVKADARHYHVKVVEDAGQSTARCFVVLVAMATGGGVPRLVDELGPFLSAGEAMNAGFQNVDMREAKARA